MRKEYDVSKSRRNPYASPLNREEHPPSPWRLPVTLLLALTLTPLAVVGWMVLSGDQRPLYWQSWCVRAGLVIALVGSAPLLFVIAAAALGLWPDPNPNPVGFGLLFVAGLAIGSLMTLLGIVLVHLRARQA